jgi:hypothetical protein
MQAGKTDFRTTPNLFPKIRYLKVVDCLGKVGLGMAEWTRSTLRPHENDQGAALESKAETSTAAEMVVDSSCWHTFEAQ